jgi:signal transduction histidine kinase
LDLNAVVVQAEKMLRRIIGEHVRLATLLQPGISPVQADLGQLNQVIVNLAVNGRDAMPKGGSLTLETREVELDADDAKAHPEVRPGRYVSRAVIFRTGTSSSTSRMVSEPRTGLTGVL